MTPTTEFALIRRYFAALTPPLQPGEVGIGDDAALLTWPRAGTPQRERSSSAEKYPPMLAVTTDTLVAGRHFFPDVDAEALGWKALAVNLSDLAAMGATPEAFLLALTLPAANPTWLERFAAGLAACASRYGAALVGGDTTRGPLTVTITALGSVPRGEAIRRDTARVTDDLWVSGYPGRAALGLAVRRGELPATLPGAAEWIDALERPEPRVALGVALRGVASAMLDLSDGLTQDATHLVENRPELALLLHHAALPLSPLIAGGAPLEVAYRALLGGGDDYELLFTAPVAQRDAVAAAAAAAGIAVHRIGTVIPRPAEGQMLLIKETDGTIRPLSPQGWDPFRDGAPKEDRPWKAAR